MQFDTSTIPATEILLMSKYHKSVLTVQEAACELDVEESEIEQMIHESRLPLVSIGCSQRISVASLARVLDGVTLDPVHYPVAKHLVNDILDDVLKDKKKSCRKLSSYKWYCTIAQHIRVYFDRVYVEDLSTEDILKFLRFVAKGSGKAKSNHFVTVINCLMKNVFMCAVHEGYIINNPYDFVKKVPKGYVTSPREKFLNDTVVKRLLFALQSSQTFRPMVILMLFSGLRIGEVLALRWSDIDRAQKIIHVQNSVGIEYDEDDAGNLINKRYEVGDTKTACSVRDVAVPDLVFDFLDEWRNYINAHTNLRERIRCSGNISLVFPNRYGEVRSYQALRRSFSRFLHTHDLDTECITFHKLRHTYASWLQTAGVDLNIIREQLGHSDIETTANIYIKVNNKPKLAAAMTLNSVFRSLVV